MAMLPHDPTQVLSGVSAYSQSASADYLLLSSSLPASNLFTICGWAVRTADTGAYAHLFSLEDSGFTRWIIYGEITGADTLHVFSDTEDSGSVGTVVTGRPFFWALTANGSGPGSLTAYYAPLGDQSMATITNSGSAGTPARLYLFNDNFSEYYAGKLWNVRLWDRVLTAGEISAARYEPVPSPRNLRAWWPLEGGQNTVLRDYSGNNRNLTKGGAGKSSRIFVPASYYRHPVIGRIGRVPAVATFQPAWSMGANSVISIGVGHAA